MEAAVVHYVSTLVLRVIIVTKDFDRLPPYILELILSYCWPRSAKKAYRVFRIYSTGTIYCIADRGDQAEIVPLHFIGIVLESSIISCYSVAMESPMQSPMQSHYNLQFNLQH